MESSPKNSDLQPWFERCSELCSSLSNQGCEYTFSLKLEGSFSFSLSSEKAVLPRTKKRSPSYRRRQLRRKADLLKKRSRRSPAEKAVGHHQEVAAAMDISSLSISAQNHSTRDCWQDLWKQRMIMTWLKSLSLTLQSMRIQP